MISLRASLHRSANRLSAGHSRQAFHGYIMKPHQQHYARVRRQCVRTLCLIFYHSPKMKLTRKSQLHTDSFLQGNSTEYLNDMYVAWCEDPSTVDASWKTYFDA